MLATEIQAPAKIREVPAGTAPEIVKRIIDEDGGVIIKGLFKAQVERFNADMDPIVSNWAAGYDGPEWMTEFAGKKTKRITQLIRRALLQTLTRFPRLGSCTVKVSCDERFQRTAFYRRGHPMGGALVLSIRHQLP